MGFRRCTSCPNGVQFSDHLGCQNNIRCRKIFMQMCDRRRARDKQDVGRLTTTQVAARAGVSVGTLYQYFPNKTSLLQACLIKHMNVISQAVEQVCEVKKGSPLLEMADALIDAYIRAKLADLQASATLYSVSSDIDGAAIAKAVSVRSHRQAARLFATAQEGLTKDPEMVATVVLAALYGIIRRVLEAKNPERHLKPLREELTVMVHGYLRTCMG